MKDMLFQNPGTRTKIFIFAFFYCLLASAPLSAHPHVFINSTVTLVFNERGLEGIRQEWIFDEMYSGPMISDCDKNRDGKLNKAEKKKLMKDYFSHLESSNYFTHISIDGGKEIAVDSVRDADVAVENNAVVYTFFIPLSIETGEKFRRISVAVYDYEFYCDFTPVVKGSLFLENAENLLTQVQFRQNKEQPYYYGFLHPDEGVVYFKKK